MEYHTAPAAIFQDLHEFNILDDSIGTLLQTVRHIQDPQMVSELKVVLNR